MEQALEKLKYPIGRFDWSPEVSNDDIKKAIRILTDFPSRIRNVVNPLNDGQLDTPYREGGWNIRQVTHHVADSHMNAYIRFKLALTEDDPVIKPYNQTEWAKLVDSGLDPAVSLSLIEGVHTRWISILNSMSDRDWDRGYIHPDQNKRQTLRKVVTLYGWHSEHHLAHIKGLVERMGW